MSDMFDKLADLEPNWDSYGAPSIDPQCIERARAIYEALRDTGPWVAVPCSSGGVQLEQHAGGFSIEISVEREP